jgi:hypothetical protein
MAKFHQWNRTPIIGDTILAPPPPEALPKGHEGYNDDRLYNNRDWRRVGYKGDERGYLQDGGGGGGGGLLSIFRKRIPHNGGQGRLWNIAEALLPIPGAGSILPHLYVPLVAELFFRSVLVVTVAILVWAMFETVLYFLYRITDAPIRWRPVLPPTVSVVDASGRKRSPSHKFWTPVRYPYKEGEVGYWVNFEADLIWTALFNPLIGFVGMFVGWYSVYAFSLVPFVTPIQSFDAPAVDGLLVLQFILFFLIAVHQGRNTAWLAVTFAVPIYILGVMVPMNRSYTHGFHFFAPYLYWLVINIVFSLMFLRDPFGVDETLSKKMYLEWWHNRTHNLADSTIKDTYHVPNETFAPYGKTLGHVLTGAPGGQVPTVEGDPRKNKYYFWSLDGTYAWNAYFAVTSTLFFVSLIKVIILAS